MSLLFQRDEDVIVIWRGRAGEYLDPSNRLAAIVFPTRQPTPAERTSAGRSEPRYFKTSRRTTREQRTARGLCLDCPNVTDDEHVRCPSCRREISRRRGGLLHEAAAV